MEHRASSLQREDTVEGSDGFKPHGAESMRNSLLCKLSVLRSTLVLVRDQQRIGTLRNLCMSL
jgi:hypothetical protein